MSKSQAPLKPLSRIFTPDRSTQTSAERDFSRLLCFLPFFPCHKVPSSSGSDSCNKARMSAVPLRGQMSRPYQRGTRRHVSLHELRCPTLVTRNTFVHTPSAPFFFDRLTQARKVSQLSQHGHVRDAEGRSAGLPLTPNISPCPKKKEKAGVKVSTVAQGQNKLHGGAADSCCAVQNTGRPDQSGLNVLSSKVKHASRGSHKQLLYEPTLARLTNSQFQRAELHTRFTWDPQSYCATDSLQA